jgi:hypothetical protein
VWRWELGEVLSLARDGRAPKELGDAVDARDGARELAAEGEAPDGRPRLGLGVNVGLESERLFSDRNRSASVPALVTGRLGVVVDGDDVASAEGDRECIDRACVDSAVDGPP